MTTLISLFKDQKTVETTIEDLAAAELGGVEFKTITHWENDVQPEQRTIPALHSAGGVSKMPAAVSIAPAWNLTEEETRFFKRSVDEGGVLLVVDVDEENAIPEVKQILQKNSRTVATSS